MKKNPENKIGGLLNLLEEMKFKSSKKWFNYEKN